MFIYRRHRPLCLVDAWRSTITYSCSLFSSLGRARVEQRFIGHNQQVLRRFSTQMPDPARILSLPAQYLRAMDASNFDLATLQRTDVSFDVTTGKPLAPNTVQASLQIRETTCDGKFYRVSWMDGSVSQYSVEWVSDTLQQWNGNPADIFGLCEAQVVDWVGIPGTGIDNDVDGDISC